MNNSIRLVLGIAGLSLVSMATPVSSQNEHVFTRATDLTPSRAAGQASFKDKGVRSIRGGWTFNTRRDILYAVATGLSATLVLWHKTSNKPLNIDQSEETIMKHNIDLGDSLLGYTAQASGSSSEQRKNLLSDFETLLLVRALAAQAAQDETSSLGFDERLLWLQAEMTAEIASYEITGKLVDTFDTNSPEALHFYEAFGRWSAEEKRLERGEA
jgi:hypothetical protein